MGLDETSKRAEELLQKYLESLRSEEPNLSEKELQGLKIDVEFHVAIMEEQAKRIHDLL